jgi:TFIIIC subunit triple barrel domain
LATPSQTLASRAGSPESSLPLEEDANAVTVEDGSDVSDDQIQILDLHSRHPVVSYRNQIFTCSWADMIGTELLFAHPEPRPVQSDLPCLQRGRDFDLIAANRVKILGHKAKLTSNPGPREDAMTAPSPAMSNLNATPSQPPPDIIPPPAATRAKGQRSNQARFLERLMNAKQARGENDIVRTVFSLRRTRNFENRLRGWARTEERMAEVQKLHRDALRGDPDALVALEGIYAQVEGGDGPSGPHPGGQDGGQDERGILPPDP